MHLEDQSGSCARISLSSEFSHLLLSWAIHLPPVMPFDKDVLENSLNHSFHSPPPPLSPLVYSGWVDPDLNCSKGLDKKPLRWTLSQLLGAPNWLLLSMNKLAVAHIRNVDFHPYLDYKSCWEPLYRTTSELSLYK